MTLDHGDLPRLREFHRDGKPDDAATDDCRSNVHSESSIRRYPKTVSSQKSANAGASTERITSASCPAAGSMNVRTCPWCIATVTGSRRARRFTRLLVRWGLAAYHRRTGDPRVGQAVQRAAEFFLERRLFRSRQTRAVIHPSWLSTPPTTITTSCKRHTRN